MFAHLTISSQLSSSRSEMKRLQQFLSSILIIFIVFVFIFVFSSVLFRLLN